MLFFFLKDEVLLLGFFSFTYCSLIDSWEQIWTLDLFLFWFLLYKTISDELVCFRFQECVVRLFTVRTTIFVERKKLIRCLDCGILSVTHCLNETPLICLMSYLRINNAGVFGWVMLYFLHYPISHVFISLLSFFLFVRVLVCVCLYAHYAAFYTTFICVRHFSFTKCLAFSVLFT